jgi:glutamate dehydrogenase/leucine dehydrogenase
MQKAFRQVHKRSRGRTRADKVNMRLASYMEGIDRVAYFTKMRGLYP